jgi:hypothetical protein
MKQTSENLPNRFRAEVTIDGKMHLVGLIEFDEDGNVTRVQTIPKHDFKAIYDLSSEALQKIRLTISRAKGRDNG